MKTKISMAMLMIAGCGLQQCGGTSQLEPRPEQWRSREELREMLRHAPEGADARADLVVAALRQGEIELAREVLSGRPDVLLRGDVLFYLGAAFESQGRLSQALRVYGEYGRLSRRSPYRDLMAGRFHTLAADERRREITRRLAREDSLHSTVHAGAVAIYPFSFVGRDPRIAPLGTGLAELLLADLQKVQRLQMVERVRLEDILNERRLQGTSAFDPQTIAEVGRLLGPERLVAGSFREMGARRLWLESSFLDVSRQAFSPPFSRSGPLDELFLLEKELAFRLLEGMGIEPSPQERRAILTIPTRNLHAFLQYSLALEEEDTGDFVAAEAHYRRAARLDPQFSQAAGGLERTRSINMSRGTLRAALEVAGELATAGPAARQRQRIESRLQMLAGNADSFFQPGKDSRTAAELVEPELPKPPPLAGDTQR